MINNIFKITIICLILVGAAGCESKSKSSSQPPTQEQQAPIDGNDQQQVQPLSQKAITAFKAFNEFQASTKYTLSDCVYKNYDAENSCLTNKNSLDADDQIEITGIAESNFEPDVLNYSNDNKYHYYAHFSSTEDPDVSLSLFTGNTLPYLSNTDDDQSLSPPFSLYTKGEDLIYAFIAEEFDIDEGTKFPAEPIRIKHGAMVVLKPLHITQTKEEAERLDKGPSHLKIEFHVKNNDGTTSIYSSANITNSEYTNYNTHHNLTDETGTVVGSFLMTKVYPIDGKLNIYHDTIEFYDTNKTLF